MKYSLTSENSRYYVASNGQGVQCQAPIEVDRFTWMDVAQIIGSDNLDENEIAQRVAEGSI